MSQINNNQGKATIYSSEQIKIPPDMPEILKNYAKFVLKTNPTDIMAASAEYLSLSLSNNFTDILIS
jgi:hypothetical protein